MSKQATKKKTVEPLTVRSSRRADVGKPPSEPKDIWAIAIFAAVIIVFFWGHLTGNAFLWEDFKEFTFPMEVFAARNFAAGVMPFWNPFTFNGMPFIADLQVGFFYPGNLLMYVFSGGELSAWLAQFFIILHYFIAMVGMWRLARGYNVGQWGAIFAGVSYGLSGLLVAHMIHPNMIFHLAWFPLIVHLFRRGVQERSWLHALLSGILLGIAMLSGHPQSALYIVFFLFCYTIYIVINDLRSDDIVRRNGIVKGLIAAALPIAIGAGIFAIQLLPSQELAGLSERAEMTYEKSLEGAMQPSQLLTLVVPKVFGVAGADTPQDLNFWLRPEVYYYWETAIYIGVATLLLAALGLASHKLGSLRWFFAGMGVLGLLYGLGDSFIIHPILSKLPLFSTFRSPVRLAVYFSLGGALLAGVGLERVIRGDEREIRGGNSEGPLQKVTLIVGGLIVFFGILTVAGILPGMLGAPDAVASRVAATGFAALLIGGITGGLAWGGLQRKLPGTGTAVLLLLLGTIDLFIFGVDQNAAPESMNPEVVYHSNDQQYANFKVSPPAKIFRLKMREGGVMLMPRNQGPYSGIMLFEGYNPLLLERRVPPAYSPQKAFDFMNIKYDVQVDQAAGRAGIVERPTAYPHARMLYDARVGSTEQVLAWLKDSTIDFGRTVLLEKEPAHKPDGSGNGTATISRYDASEIEVKVTTDKPGILLLSEVWYPAWKVTLDGNDADLLVADYSLRGVAIPTGTHTVVMRYQSDAFSTGLWITIATSVLAVAGVVLLGMGRKKQQGPSTEDETTTT